MNPHIIISRIQPSERCDRFFHCRFHLRLVGYIAPYAYRIIPFGGQFLRPFHYPAIYIDQRYRCSGFGKHTCRHKSYASGRSRYESRFVFECYFHILTNYYFNTLVDSV